MTSRIHLPRLVSLACLVAACQSPVEPPSPAPPPPPPQPALTGPGPFVVSDAIPIVAVGGVTSQGSPGSDHVAFVSLVPGSMGVVPRATTISIHVPRTGVRISAALAHGGLDPVAVPAVVGDTVYVTVTGPAEVTTYGFTIPALRSPVVIRTVPEHNTLHGPLNQHFEVVFSEPIDSALLTPSGIELRAGGNPVAGQATFANLAHTAVRFTPTEELAPGTQYELVPHTGIRDLTGTLLEAEVRISFTTAAMITTPVSGLTFVRDGQIYTIDSNGGLMQLTHTGPGETNGGPAWSPDGKRLAFALGADRDWDIYVMNADGSNVVARTSGGYNVEPTWSPDGRFIAFTSVQDGSAGISVVEADGESPPRVLLDRPGYDAEPAWSPDGQYITFTSDWRAYDFLYDLYVMNADGSEVQELLAGPFFSADTLKFFRHSAWSPDGQKIAVSVCEWGVVDCVPNSAIGVINADGSGLTLLARGAGYSDPTWSPDGGMIAFGAVCSPTCGSSSLRLVQADGSGEGIILTNGHSPAWRPLTDGANHGNAAW